MCSASGRGPHQIYHRLWSRLWRPRLRLLPSRRPTAEVTAIAEPTSPVAGERPHRYTHHEITVEDPWHWLEDEDYPTVDDEDVLAYLVA